MIEKIAFTPEDRMSSGVFLYIGERCNSGAKDMIALVKTFSCCAEFMNHIIISREAWEWFMFENKKFYLRNEII